MPLDPIEEAKFEKLKENCRELGVLAPPEIHIHFELRDKEGNLLVDDTQRGHSWTRNFYNWMFSQMTHTQTTGENDFGAGFISSKNIDGTNRYLSGYGAGISGTNTGFSNENFGYISAVNSSDSGIVVGTSNTAFSAEHHSLGAIIASGTGSGQLSYEKQITATPTYAAKKWTATMTRKLENNSGASITVKESGLYWGTTGPGTATFFTSATGRYMTERSVLNPELLMPNGSQLTITYKTSMDFSAID